MRPSTRRVLTATKARISRVVPVVLICLQLVGLPSFGQAGDLGRFLDWAADDPIDVVRQVDLQDGMIILGTAAVLTALAFADKPISQWARTHSGGGTRRFLTATNELGGQWALPMTAALFGISLVVGNELMQDATFTSLESVLLSSVLVIGAKTVIGRRRPHEGRDHLSFAPFHSLNASFPSGHTANAFAAVVPWFWYHRNPLTATLLGVAATTGAARVVKGHHWPTDVVAGAIIGSAVGIVLSKRHMRQPSDANALINAAPKRTILLAVSKSMCIL